MLILTRLSILLFVIMFSGCAGRAVRQADEPMVAEAESRLRASDYSAAAQIFLQLAERSSDADHYRLRAADAELRAGNGQAAQALLGAVKADDLDDTDQHRYILLRSRIDLNLGLAKQAMARLDTLDPQHLEPPLVVHYHTLRASAYNQLGNMLESARERVALGPLLSSPEAVMKNNEAIYDALGRLPETALAGMRPPPPDTLGGWMALTAIMKGPKAQRAEAVQTWLAQYPGHPAEGAFVERLVGKKTKGAEVTPLKAAETAPPVQPNPPAASAPTPGNPFIGVMLPLTGTYAPAAKAVRAGLMAAYNADANSAKPSLRFVDTQGGDVAAIYRQLAGEGAQWVIGPLIKEDVAKLAQGGGMTVPVLALNQTADVTHEKLYQFALTPEQEVEQSAGSAWFDGRQNALMLAPASAFGQRMINHFSGYWKSLGGKIVAIKTYSPDSGDYAGPIKDLLVGGGQPGLPAADFVFVDADARDVRPLLTSLRAQGGAQLPVYATARFFSGHQDSSQEQALSGLIFCDIPWLLNSGDGGALSRQNMQDSIQQSPADYIRLIAMGIDAYHLIPQLPRFVPGSQSRFAGETGALTLMAGNRIQRQLHCGQFGAGTLQPRGIAPLLQPGVPAEAVSKP